MSGEIRVLLAGSAGFIGSHIMENLLGLGIQVWGVDNYSPYYAPSMKIAREEKMGHREKTIKADISNLDELRKVFELVKPNVVINLAAQGGVRASRTNPRPYLETNQIGFLNLLEFSRDFGVFKFIYASSSSVYGDSTAAPFLESVNLPAPKSLYALSKLSNEVIAQNFYSPGMQKLGLRFFTVYGPWGRPDMAMFRILASSVLKRKFVLTASRSVERDFTYVGDLCQVVVNLISTNALQNEHEILNVAGGKPYSLDQLFKILIDFNSLPEIVNAEHDNLDVQLTHGSISKLREFGLPVPSTTLAHGVEQTLEWVSELNRSNLNEWYEYNS